MDGDEYLIPLAEGAALNLNEFFSERQTKNSKYFYIVEKR